MINWERTSACDTCSLAELADDIYTAAAKKLALADVIVQRDKLNTTVWFAAAGLRREARILLRAATLIRPLK